MKKNTEDKIRNPIFSVRRVPALCFLGMTSVLFLASCAVPPMPTSDIIRQQMGPQGAALKTIGESGGEDPVIAAAVQALIASAQELGLGYDASLSKSGVVTIDALWKQDRVNLRFRFLKEKNPETGDPFAFRYYYTEEGKAHMDLAGKKLVKLLYETWTKKYHETQQ